MTILANPPPLKIPAKIMNDPEMRGFFDALVKSIYLIWVRTGGGTGVVDSSAVGPALASIAGLTTTANQMLYTTASNTYATVPINAVARAFMNAAVDPIEDRAAPGAIGATTPAVGAFTTLTASTALGLFGATPVGQGAALTADLTHITHTAPGTPDYAIANLTNIAPYGFVSQDEGNTALSVIRNLQTRVAQLEARLDATTGIGVFA